MFERYTEDARRVIFFARFEASAFNSAEISTKHLLLGILHECRELVGAVLKRPEAVDELRTELIGSPGRVAGGVSTSVDMPLSLDSKRVLAYAMEEADRLEHRTISPVHLLLGLLRDDTAAPVLHAHGLTRSELFEYASASRPAESRRQPSPRVDPRGLLLALVHDLPEELIPQAEHLLRSLIARHRP